MPHVGNHGIKCNGAITLEHYRFQYMHQGSEYFLIGTNGKILLAFMVRENGERVDYVESKGQWKR